ncbi:MAG: undecaprenyl-phosphate glucose phosphotransferase [bacterium]
MRLHDTSDAISSSLAVLADALAIFGGFMLATWVRFDSGWISLFHDSPPERLYFAYGWGAVIATLTLLFLFRNLGLYVRPQHGVFPNYIPRLVRAVLLGMLLTTAIAFAVRTTPPYSRLTVALACGIVLILVLIERALLFRAEIRLARHSTHLNRVLIVGANDVAAHLRRALQREPRLRSQVVAFLRTDAQPPDPGVPAELIMDGTPANMEALLTKTRATQVIVTDSRMPHTALVELIVTCERAMVTFNLVPDIARILTGGMDMHTVDDIPLLGISRWPLDLFWNRIAKRTEDVVGAVLGLLCVSPFIAAAAIAIKRTSPGPVFHAQERCGKNGCPFVIYKLRTMESDAEKHTGPVWTVKDDPRVTPFGGWLRRNNLDELPQLWNVLRGDMSLVGPRPERPAFVEKFKDDIDKYMWRHVVRPGMTGWAQVNGLRGNTSIEERIKYDLYYLENWSLSLDFKILLKTLGSRKNAY